MNIDLELAKKILFVVEEHNPKDRRIVLGISGHSQETTSHHVELLHEAGLIKAADYSSLRHYWEPKSLTEKGTEICTLLRNSSYGKLRLKKLLKETQYRLRNRS